ncbi:MAG: hypothetical protein GXP44_02385 [bacterium]|nr:hypothetical protein [bacterium]
MKQFSLKFIVFLLIVGINYSGILAIGETLAFYNDTESAGANLMQAGVIDFSLKDNGFNPIEPSISLEPGDATVKNIDILPENNSNPFRYYASTTNFSGDGDFCDALNVDARTASSSMYSGSLKGLLTGATTTLDSWDFEIGMGTNNFQNKVCDFDVVYNGWQTRHNYPTYENGGFSDTEKVSSAISSWGLRLNKVYYDVAPDRGVEGDNEWVEIFNQTSVPLDISGWSICDSDSCDVIPASDPIPAMGYGVITASSTTWGYWYVPSEVVKIILPDGKIGNGLANEGDALFLKRPDGVVIDEMNWQSDTNVWDPGVPGVTKGDVLARVPNGYDTDQASDWKELVPPEVDLIYPDEDESYSWYWNHNYEIQWTAVNPNGDDADLAIDLYYIKDVNGDGEISGGDTKHNIVMGTANDGSEWWKLPSGFTGYIWIELTATGPENPLLNSTTVSGDIWDPNPIFVSDENSGGGGGAAAATTTATGIATTTPKRATTAIPAIEIKTAAATSTAATTTLTTLPVIEFSVNAAFSTASTSAFAVSASTTPATSTPKFPAAFSASSTPATTTPKIVIIGSAIPEIPFFATTTPEAATTTPPTIVIEPETVLAPPAASSTPGMKEIVSALAAAESEEQQENSDQAEASIGEQAAANGAITREVNEEVVLASGGEGNSPDGGDNNEDENNENENQ